MITSILTPENQAQWLKQASVLSKRELQKEIVKHYPKKAVIPVLRPVAEDRYEFKVGISEELHQSILRVQDLLSQKVGRPATLEEVLAALVHGFLAKNDPLKKAERAIKRRVQRPSHEKLGPLVPAPKKEAHTSHTSGPAKNPYARAPIPADVRHAVTVRDKARCTHIDPKGQRCCQRRWLHYHHRIPRSRGGESTTSNLTLLCSSHHRLHHEKGTMLLSTVRRSLWTPNYPQLIEK